MLAGPWLGTIGDAVTVGFGAADVIQGNDKNYPERAAARTVAARIPVLGGQREFREAAANLAGEPKKKGGRGLLWRVLLAGAGGGGYYAYSEGMLDDLLGIDHTLPDPPALPGSE